MPGVAIKWTRVEHLQFMILGALIMLLVVAEPHGFDRLGQIDKQKLRVWLFPY
jgi:branched-chain amino acid transport system permease protein